MAGADGYRIRLGPRSATTRTWISAKNIEIDGGQCRPPQEPARAGLRVVIRGQVTVSAAHSATNHVTVNASRSTTPPTNTHPFVGIQVNSAGRRHGHPTAYSSRRSSTASNTIVDRAILLTTAATGIITRSTNLFTGAAHSAFGSASWTTGIWSGWPRGPGIVDRPQYVRMGSHRHQRERLQQHQLGDRQQHLPERRFRHLDRRRGWRPQCRRRQHHLDRAQHLHQCRYRLQPAEHHRTRKPIGFDSPPPTTTPRIRPIRSPCSAAPAATP